VAETIDQRAASAFDQGGQLLEYPRAVLGVKTVGPALGVGEHVLRREAHDRADVLADERAGEIAGGLGRVDDGGADGEQVLKTVALRAEHGRRRVSFGFARRDAALLAARSDGAGDAGRTRRLGSLHLQSQLLQRFLRLLVNGAGQVGPNTKLALRNW